MPRVDDQQLAVASVYSRALLELARENGQEDDLLEEIQGVARVLEENQDLASFFDSPVVDAEARRKVIDQALRGRLSDLLVDALQVLNRKDRLGLLPAVAEGYRRAHRDAKGIIEVAVKSALPLSEPQRAELRRQVTAVTGREAQFVENVDPSILGGLVVQFGDQKIDASVASRLKDLSQRLLERGAREVLRGAAFEVNEGVS
jgi:F-type H+-transporting ATPase subunit delta